jgi:hypothetical protein
VLRKVKGSDHVLVATNSCYQKLLPKVTTKSCYQKLLPKVATKGYYQKLLPKVTIKSYYQKLLPKVTTKSYYQKLLPKVATFGLFIYSTKACLRGKEPPRLGHLAPASEVAGGQYLTIFSSRYPDIAYATAISLKSSSSKRAHWFLICFYMKQCWLSIIKLLLISTFRSKKKCRYEIKQVGQVGRHSLPAKSAGQVCRPSLPAMSAGQVCRPSRVASNSVK